MLKAFFIMIENAWLNYVKNAEIIVVKCKIKEKKAKCKIFLSKSFILHENKYLYTKQMTL